MNVFIESIEYKVSFFMLMVYVILLEVTVEFRSNLNQKLYLGFQTE